uniref:response regulator n=1 Tax=Pseudomonas lundensis TaxID=86185 RepID=UPI0028D7C114|nr:response regulator [Pseudomonas lundensis]
MTEHDILSDAEREALSEVMKAPAPVQPVQCVLIVEDDQFARDLLSELLQMHGIPSIKAASARQAIRALMTEKTIGLILTDLRMPERDGLHLVRKVRRSQWANLPVIIMSGDAEVRDTIAAMHLSVVDFLLKPIDTDELLNLIKRELRIE